MTFVTLSKVEFVDVLTADALTSMSKLLADMQASWRRGRTLCFLLDVGATVTRFTGC